MVGTWSCRTRAQRWMIAGCLLGDVRQRRLQGLAASTRENLCSRPPKCDGYKERHTCRRTTHEMRVRLWGDASPAGRVQAQRVCFLCAPERGSRSGGLAALSREAPHGSSEWPSAATWTPTRSVWSRSPSGIEGTSRPPPPSFPHEVPRLDRPCLVEV